MPGVLLLLISNSTYVPGQQTSPQSLHGASSWLFYLWLIYLAVPIGSLVFASFLMWLIFNKLLGFGEEFELTKRMVAVLIALAMVGWVVYATIKGLYKYL